MEQKQIHLQITKAEKNVFAGMASTKTKDLVGDIVDPEAFRGSIEKNIPVLFQHDPKETIGKITKMKIQKDGLFVEGKISETERGKEVITLMKDGALDSMSIGFNIIDSIFEGDARVIKNLELYEISIVTMPAQPEARVLAVKNQKQAQQVSISGEGLHEFMAFFLQDDEIRELSSSEGEQFVLDVEQENVELLEEMTQMFEVEISYPA